MLLSHEARPDSPNCNLIASLGAHLLVEVLQIVFSPFASVGRPPFRPGMHPCVLAVKGRRILWRRIVLVDKEWRGLPMTHHVPDLFPVRVASFWEDKDYRAAFV